MRVITVSTPHRRLARNTNMERRGVSDGSAACSKLNKCEPKENSRDVRKKSHRRAFPSALSRQGSSFSLPGPGWRCTCSSKACLLAKPQAGCTPAPPFWQSTTQKHILPVNGPIKKANVFKQGGIYWHRMRHPSKWEEGCVCAEPSGVGSCLSYLFSYELLVWNWQGFIRCEHGSPGGSPESGGCGNGCGPASVQTLCLCA